MTAFLFVLQVIGCLVSHADWLMHVVIVYVFVYRDPDYMTSSDGAVTCNEDDLLLGADGELALLHIMLLFPFYIFFLLLVKL